MQQQQNNNNDNDNNPVYWLFLTFISNQSLQKTRGDGIYLESESLTLDE